MKEIDLRVLRARSATRISKEHIETENLADHPETAIMIKLADPN